jgi:hypothetical protein
MTDGIFIGIQSVIGLAIFAGSFLTLRESIDASTPTCRRALFVCLLGAGAWYAMEPLMLGIPTSTKPGLLFAAFAAWVMLRWRRALVSAAGLH